MRMAQATLHLLLYLSYSSALTSEGGVGMKANSDDSGHEALPYRPVLSLRWSTRSSHGRPCHVHADVFSHCASRRLDGETPCLTDLCIAGDAHTDQRHGKHHSGRPALQQALQLRLVVERSARTAAHMRHVPRIHHVAGVYCGSENYDLLPTVNTTPQMP